MSAYGFVVKPMTDDVEYFDIALYMDNGISLKRYNEIINALEEIGLVFYEDETEFDEDFTYLHAQYPDTIPFPKLEQIIEGIGNIYIDYDAMADWMDDYVEDSE